MPTAPYLDGHLSVWRGNDVLSFIDGLSTNHVLDLKEGQFRLTTFTTAQAKVIDRVGLFHMGAFVAVFSHGPYWKSLFAHISPRILGQDVTISNATENNNFFIQFGVESDDVGTFSSSEGTTVAHCLPHINYIVASKNSEVQVDSSISDFHEWRVDHVIPWQGFEISEKHHAFACGLADDVHPAKGCYIGQELLTRMRTRGKMGRELICVDTNQASQKDITTRGLSKSLAIVRL